MRQKPRGSHDGHVPLSSVKAQVPAGLSRRPREPRQSLLGMAFTFPFLADTLTRSGMTFLLLDKESNPKSMCSGARWPGSGMANLVLGGGVQCEQ